MAFGILEAVLLVITILVAVKLFILDKKQPTTSTATTTSKKEVSEKKASDKNKPKMKIFYGSQSGTAETFASELNEESLAYGFDSEVVDLEDYDDHEELGEEKFCVFLMSTFGEGEPTDNATNFWEWIKADDRLEESEDFCKGVDFAVFALGNRQYEHFCNVGREIDGVLGKMGGNRIVAHGEGDDDGTMDEDYATWKDNFWEATRKKYGLSEMEEKKFEPKWNVEHVGTVAEPKDSKEYKSGHGLLQDPKYSSAFGTVICNRELRQDVSDGGSTFHMDLDVTGIRKLRFCTADNLGIFPRNDYKLAGKMVKLLKARPDQLFVVKKSSKWMYPRPCSALDAMLWHVDLTAIPRLKTVKLLAQYAENAAEANKIRSFADNNKEVYLTDQKNMVELFEEFPSLNVPFEHFLEFAPKFVPRFYTISSSALTSATTIGVTVSVLRNSKPRDRMYEGVTTNFLNTMKEGTKVACFVRASSFRLPRRNLSTTPIIMFGPGTGIAPFRAFIQEFTTMKAQEMKLPETTLFFGCRRSTEDYIYKDELEKAKEEGILTNLHLAFSREQEQKVYVQDILARPEMSEKIWNQIYKEKAYVFVCGATSMGRRIREQIIDIAQTRGGMTPEAAADYMKSMQNTNRYVAELWA